MRNKTFRLLVRTVAISCTLLVLSAACENSSSPSAGSTKSKLDTVLSSGTLRVATFATNPPFASIDSSGQLVGYDVDVANLLAK